MTSQTKKFINLDDIIAFRFRCKNEKCGAELCLPLQDTFARMRTAEKCPNCAAGWLVVGDNTVGSNTAQNMDKIIALIKAISQWPGQCEITLEIKPDPITKATV